MTEPARGYSWKPFEPGHELSKKHGVYSPRTLAPLAAERREELVTVDAPDLARPRWTGPVASLAWAEAAIAQLREYLDGVGLLDDDGNPRPALAALERWEGRAGRLRNDLALTPASLAKLLGALSATTAASDDDALESLVREGEAIRSARFAELEPPPDEPDEAETDTDEDQTDTDQEGEP